MTGKGIRDHDRRTHRGKDESYLVGPYKGLRGMAASRARRGGEQQDHALARCEPKFCIDAARGVDIAAERSTILRRRRTVKFCRQIRPARAMSQSREGIFQALVKSVVFIVPAKLIMRCRQRRVLRAYAQAARKAAELSRWFMAGLCSEAIAWLQTPSRPDATWPL